MACLACFIVVVVFFYKHSAWDGTIHINCALPHKFSIKNTYHRFAHRPIWWVCGGHFFLSWGSLFHDDSCLCRGDVQTSQGTLCAWRQRAGGRLPGSTTLSCSLAAGPRTELERQLTKRSNLPLSVDTTQCWNPVHLQTHPTFNVCAGDSNTGSRLAHQVILHIQPSYSVLLATEVGM